jgi:hypothetical protein
MNNAELAEKIQAVEKSAKGLTVAINELVGPEPEGPVATHGFAAQMHLQDALNRVSNITVFLAQKTDESIAAAVDDATASGNLKII